MAHDHVGYSINKEVTLEGRIFVKVKIDDWKCI